MVALSRFSAGRRRLPPPSARLRLGRTPIRVSPLSIGVVGTPSTIAAAFEAGINFFFVTADLHWPLYEQTRRGLAALFRTNPGARSQVVVAGVCYPTQPEFNVTPFQELVGAISGLGYLDVAVMGGTYAGDCLARLGIYEHHRRTRRLGVRAVGASFHDRAVVPHAVNRGLVDIAFARYNPGHPAAREDMFPFVSAERATPLFNFTSTSGFVPAARRQALGVPREEWQPDVTDCYRFAFSRPEVDGVLCAPRTPRQLRGILDALDRGSLTDDEQNVLVNLARLDRGEVRLDGTL